jgi:hypothetical protein
MNFDTNNDVDNIEQIYYVQQLKRKIFKHIPSKIRKNAQFINIFTYNFKSYHMAVGININLIDDYQKFKWRSPILTIVLNSDIIIDYSPCKLILNENCLLNNRYKIIGDVFKNTYDVYQK